MLECLKIVSLWKEDRCRRFIVNLVHGRAGPFNLCWLFIIESTAFDIDWNFNQVVWREIK